MSKLKNKIHTKPQRIIRNVILSVILLAGAYFITWVANDFPTPTAEMALRRCEEATFTDKSEIVEICRNDTDKGYNENYVSVIGLTDKYIHLTVARHVGIGELQFMYRPTSFMNIPRSRDGLDFVPLSSSASGKCTYNEVYNFDGCDPDNYSKEADDYDYLYSCMGIIFCDNDEIAYINVELDFNQYSSLENCEYKFTCIRKNDSGIYPIRFFLRTDDLAYEIGCNLEETDYDNNNFDYIYRDYYGYSKNYFFKPPRVIIKGYSTTNRLVIEKHFNE